MNRILYIEDNPEYNEYITRRLRESGYDVDTSFNALEAIEKVAIYSYDLILSDLNLEDIDGIRLISTAKNIDPYIRTAILTGNPSAETELAAIDLHIDLYLDKTRDFSVIVKYIENLFLNDIPKVAQHKQRLVSKKENIIVDLDTRIVTKEDTTIDCTPIEFGILETLLRNKSKVVSRNEILTAAWPNDCNDGMNERIIDVHVKNLRMKLKTFSIASIRGVGYKWNE
ncbi:response regulator transcription factor [Erysipelothrix sp. HDW6C]|uniref:response regulator transcription factor n=1 Tax=Erysipelothrix sp. HDW6C TaxID=2714930 RepID=UPI0014092834|nr:response regulator transcription factor [Erysipelothrix sp. HDW6C]QIK68982.1 response regulator transcription factor [Erysipelothrix sp. HDW6C]